MFNATLNVTVVINFYPTQGVQLNYESAMYHVNMGEDNK